MVNEQILSELYNLEKEEFIRAAYKIIFERVADEEGVRNNLEALENGTTKEMMVFSMLTSEESYVKNVTVLGFRIGSIPLGVLIEQPDDDRFIKASYIAILGRNADESGRENFLEAMYKGRIDRLDVIIALRDSAEGKSVGTEIVGIKRFRRRRKTRNAVYRIPVFGKGIRFFRNLVQISRTYNVRLGNTDQWLGGAEQRLGNTDQRLGSTEQRLGSAEQRLDSSEQRLENLREKMDEMYTSYTLESIRMARVSELTTGVAYKKYEDEMRGSREEIVKRLKIYNAVFENVKAANGDKINALDLGCGRGEWLELAQDTYGVYALGVDSDASMLSDCKKNGLNAIKADLVAYIKNAASNSVDIISMFQVAEHLPVAVLNEVLTECYRVLRKGGALIVETPNPENMIVGSCNFYFDPTHINKLPPALLRILVEGTGLKRAEIVRMHEYGAIEIDEESDTETTAVKQMARFFNNYADYAVIAYKE